MPVWRRRSSESEAQSLSEALGEVLWGGGARLTLVKGERAESRRTSWACDPVVKNGKKWSTGGQGVVKWTVNGVAE